MCVAQRVESVSEMPLCFGKSVMLVGGSARVSQRSPPPPRVANRHATGTQERCWGLNVTCGPGVDIVGGGSPPQPPLPPPMTITITIYPFE